MGYADESKGFRIWSLEDKSILISRDVKFIDEGVSKTNDLDIVFPDEMNDEGDDGEDRDPDGEHL